MNELFPVLSGVVIGIALGAIAPKLRIPVALTLALVLGFVATVISGEYSLSWGYLLVDIPLVGVATATSYLVARAIRLRSLAR
jgi:hypothetical protein